MASAACVCQTHTKLHKTATMSAFHALSLRRRQDQMQMVMMKWRTANVLQDLRGMMRSRSVRCADQAPTSHRTTAMMIANLVKPILSLLAPQCPLTTKLLIAFALRATRSLLKCARDAMLALSRVSPSVTLPAPRASVASTTQPPLRPCARPAPSALLALLGLLRPTTTRLQTACVQQEKRPQAAPRRCIARCVKPIRTKSPPQAPKLFICPK